MGTDVGYLSEGVWDVPTGPTGIIGASGGGVSQQFSKPNYQAGTTPPDGQRDVPDVALFAGIADAGGVPNPGAFIEDDPNRANTLSPGQSGACIACCTGGTSLATT